MPISSSCLEKGAYCSPCPVCLFKDVLLCLSATFLSLPAGLVVPALFKVAALLQRLLSHRVRVPVAPVLAGIRPASGTAVGNRAKVSSACRSALQGGAGPQDPGHGRAGTQGPRPHSVTLCLCLSRVLRRSRGTSTLELPVTLNTMQRGIIY